MHSSLLIGLPNEYLIVRDVLSSRTPVSRGAVRGRLR